MPVESKTYYGTIGSNIIYDAELAFVTILGVKREGRGYIEIDTVPTGGYRGFMYEENVGGIVFDPDTPFTTTLLPTDPVFATAEKVFVLFKY